MLDIGNKVYRNLQEQVGYNSEQIKKIFSILDGIDYEDHVVVIEDISIPLTEEEMLIVNEPVSFLVYNDKLYFKDSSDEDKLYFSAVIEIQGTDIITLKYDRISVDISNGEMELVNSISDIYSKDKIDEQISNLETLISGLADGSPKGVYATLADLQTAYPTGANGIYVVSADGHWYYWNGAAWTDGGNYLSTISAVPETRTIAGVELDHDITKNELQDAIDIDKIDKGIVRFIPTFEQGGIDNTTGEDTEDVNYVRTGFISRDELFNCPIVNNDTIYAFRYFFYRTADDSSFISYNTVNKETSAVFSFPNNAYYVRIRLITAMQNNVVFYHNIKNVQNILGGLYGVSAIGGYLTDLDNASKNVIYRVPANSSNTPTTYDGITVSFSQDSETLFQLFIESNGKLYYRLKWGATWKNWVSLANDRLLKLKSFYGQSSQNILADCNSADANTIYRVDNGTTQNTPVAASGMLVCFSSASDVISQIFLRANGDVWSRTKYGANFSNWQWLNANGRSVQYPFIDSPANFATLNKVGVIGDSYASGQIKDNGSWIAIYEQSWLQLICKNCGIVGHNFSFGGATTATWLTNAQRGLAKLTSTEKCNCYIIALGINDVSSVSLGTPSDIGTENTTFYGYYSKIIEQVLAYNPHAKIICSTMSSNSLSSSPFNQAIIAIAQHYSLPYIIQYDDDFFKSTYYNTMVEGHPTTVTYGGMANALRRMIEICMAENQTYFSDINVYNE